MSVWRLGRSWAWNAAHPPKLPPRPRRLPPGRPITLFGRPLEGPVGIAAGPLPSSRWVLAFARLGYGVLTYGTVRTGERAAFPGPNVLHCRLGDPAVIEPRTPRRPDPATVSWAVSLGLPSRAPDVWRADVAHARARLGAEQLLVVSVVGTPGPDGEAEALAEDYALAARWAAEAGADVVELLLAPPEGPRPVLESPDLAVRVVTRARRAVGRHPLVAKLGAQPGPRALHELASRLAPWVDGFVLVNGLQRRVVTAAGGPAFPGAGRELAQICGADVYAHTLVQVEELVAWRKAGAWTRTILAVGGLTTVDRVRAALEAGADVALVATAALIDPLLAARFRQAEARRG